MTVAYAIKYVNVNKFDKIRVLLYLLLETDVRVRGVMLVLLVL